MLLNYTLGKELSLHKIKDRKYVAKKLLVFGVVANLSLLGYFKYADFFIVNVNSLMGTEVPLLHLALPLAISFYTFQQIAYLVDSYKQETKEYDFLNYAVFVTFFPQLIAGPIVHHSEMMPQFAKLRNKAKNYSNIALGLFIFSIGLFKKVVIADTFAIWATKGFDVAPTLNMLEAWVTSLSYTFQLYFDFSGYADMAIGLALLFNIKIPINFFSPYKATNIQDFWRRWHMTLSRFLKEYIYIPLGGNRKGEIHTYINLFATFLLAGIWHGAGWTFVFWGALHGVALMTHRAWQKLGLGMPTLLAWFITFNFINIAWVFFRATSFESAEKVLFGMFNIHSLEFMTYTNLEGTRFFYINYFTTQTIAILTLLGLAFVSVLVFKNSNQLQENLKKRKKIPLFWVLLTVFMLGISLMTMVSSNQSEFLYFNF